LDTVIFMADLIAYAFEGVPLLDTKCMGGEYLNNSRNVIY